MNSRAPAMERAPRPSGTGGYIQFTAHPAYPPPPKTKLTNMSTAVTGLPEAATFWGFCFLYILYIVLFSMYKFIFATQTQYSGLYTGGGPIYLPVVKVY